MVVVKKGDSIKVEYEGRFEDGTVFDSSKKHGTPLEFKVDSGQVVKGFDDAVTGMEVGEEKEFTIKPEQAYGEYNEKLKQKVPKDKLPPGHEPKEGMVLLLSTPQGQQMPVRIVAVNENDVTLDMNHPLAGKTLIFKIKILEINWFFRGKE